MYYYVIIYNKSKFMSTLFGRALRYIQRHTKRALYANRFYNWYIFSRKLSRLWYETANKHYANSMAYSERAQSKTVIFLCNGFVEHGGWGDRLKGILSTYAVCKNIGVDFRLSFTSPFPLTDYLVPNTYDWTIGEDEVIYDRTVSDVITLEIGAETDWQARKQYDYLKENILRSSARQIHVYTNAHFAYNYGFSELFNELFKPTERLRVSIEKCKRELGYDYVSVSSRFINSLGDFEDTQKMNALPQPLRQQLLDRCVEQVRLLHESNPNSRILVCSDSSTFLNALSALPYTYVYSGRMVHFDVNTPNSSYELYEKTFVDFMLIAEATHIYRLETRWVRNSGFPYAASKVYGHPFHSICF